jgi:hypothetical protein
VLEEGDAMKLSGQLEALRGLGANSPEVLTRLDAIRKDIPTRIVVMKTQPLGWGNRNAHSQFRSDQNQVMVADPIGTTDLDFSPFCGTLTLSK